jgi:cobalt-zinc-cadmium resistance protein CzcA
MIGRLVTFSVERRWLVLLVTALAALMGVFALQRLPIDAVPDITNNQVQVNVLAPSLSPDQIERQVSFTIETSLAGIPGLDHTRSLNRNGFAQITAVFTDSTDIYFARQQVAERLRMAQDRLPAGVMPEMGPIATGLGDIFMWTVEFQPRNRGRYQDGEPGVQSDGSYITPEGERLVNEAEKATYLRTVQQWIVAPQLRGTPGVAGVDSLGGYERQYLVIPDVQRLAALNITVQDLATTLERSNTSIGAGTVEHEGAGLFVRSDARVGSSDELARTVIATRQGVPVLLSQVAVVRPGQGIRTGSASENGHEVVVGTAIMRIGENSRTVASAVRERLELIGRSLPAEVVVKPVLDRAVLVNTTIATVARNLAEGAALVILVLFLLLGNFRAALIAALVIPITMLLAATGMLRAGVSANLMSLGALDFGLIVDGAIIIVENALRRLGERQREIEGEPPFSERLAIVAASAREMIRPSVYGQAIIILVYAPLLTFSGVEGKMFEPMALTVIIALAFAFILSLTFVPAAVAAFLVGRIKEKESRVMLWLRSGYAPGLDAAMQRPRLTIGGAIAAVALAALAFNMLGQEFLPQLDEGNVLVQAWRPPGTSVEQSQRMQFAVEQAISREPEVQYAFSRTGTSEIGADPMPSNATDTFVILKPRSEWPNPRLPKAELVERIERRVSTIPGNSYEITQPIQMRFNELIAGVRGDIAVKVFGDDFATMNATATRIAAVLRNVRGAADVRVEQTEGLPLLDIRPNRDAMARVGVTPGDMQDVVAATIGGREAGVIFEGDRRFPVVIRLADTARSDMQSIGQIPIPTGGGSFVPLSSVADIAIGEEPNQISRENGKRRVVVQANVRGRDVAGVVEDAQREIAARVPLPPGTYLQWGGQFENLATARARLQIVVPVCFAIMMLLLFGALRSVRDAALVFTGVPLALVGGIIALILRGLPFSISAAVGFIALSGVAVLNGLVMVSSIQDLMREGMGGADAARAGALLRFRPVAMTALVASLGFVPMAIARGPGSEVQAPLATVVIGGLISSTLLTLFVLPTLYARFASFDVWEPTVHLLRKMRVVR